MIVEGDKGSRDAGKGYIGKFVIASRWVGEELGMGVWFVLFRTSWIEERSYMAFLLAFTHVTENSSDDFFSCSFFTSWHFQLL